MFTTKVVKENLFVNYERENNSNLLPDPLPIKLLNKVSKVPRSLIAPVINQGGLFDAWKVFLYHCTNIG